MLSLKVLYYLPALHLFLSISGPFFVFPFSIKDTISAQSVKLLCSGGSFLLVCGYDSSAVERSLQILLQSDTSKYPTRSSPLALGKIQVLHNMHG